MQFATQSRAEALGYQVPDFFGLAYIYPDSPNPSVDASSTAEDHAWDGTLMGDLQLEYAALAGALASGGMVLATPASLGPTIAPQAHLGYDTVNSSYASRFDDHMAAQFPGVSCAPTPGDDLLWGNASLFPEEPVDIDSWSSLMGIPPSLTAAGHAVNRVPDPAELWQGPYDSMRASIEATFQTYSAFSSSSPGTSSPASDWTAIFSPAASMCSPETVPTASSSALPSPEPTMITPSPLASRNRRDRKATPHGGRVRSSASRAAKQSPIIPSFASVRTTAPRNKQIPVDEVRDPVCRGGTWFCSNCPYQSRRKGDLRRHVRSHSDDTGYYVCCGVPVEDAPGHVGDIRFHEGREMVGGCDKAFKRKDSLLRHLKASNGVCIRPVYL